MPASSAFFKAELIIVGYEYRLEFVQKTIFKYFT